VLKADFIIFLSSSETVLMQVHLDAPQADLDARGAVKGAGSVPATLCVREMFKLMIYINILWNDKSRIELCIRVSEQRTISRSALRKGLPVLSIDWGCRFRLFC
jgi:hypothetical protein